MANGDGRFCRNHWVADARLLGSIPSVRRRSVTRHDPWVNWDIRWDFGPYRKSRGRVDDSNSRCNSRALVARRILVPDF